MATEEAAYDADKMLDVYIYDFLKKRKFEESANVFLVESKLVSDSSIVAIDIPDGIFLLDWWTVFWELFKVRSGLPHSEIAGSYLESQQTKLREQPQQRPRMQNSQFQAMLDTFSKSAQEHAPPCMKLELRPELKSPDHSLLRQPTLPSPEKHTAEMSTLLREATSSVLTNNLLLQSLGSVDDTGGSSTDADSNSPSVASIPTAGNQQTLNSLSNQGSTMNQGGNTSQLRQRMQLKGGRVWPLTSPRRRKPLLMGLDNFLQSPTQSSPAQRAFTAQIQQQMYSRLQNQASPSRVSAGPSGLNPLVTQNSTEREGIHSNAVKDVGFSEGAVTSPSLLQATQDDQEMFKLTSQAQLQQLEAQSNGIIARQLQRQRPSEALDSMSGGVQGSNTFGRKRKENSDSSEHPSLGETNNVNSSFSPSPTSDPFLLLTDFADKTCQPLESPIAFSMDSPSIANESFITNGELEEGNHAAVETDVLLDSSLSMLQDGSRIITTSVPGDSGSHQTIHPVKVHVNPQFSFDEVSCLKASSSKVSSCHFSTDGNLLASAGHDKKVRLWNMSNWKVQHTLEEHSLLITDVRFSPTSAHLATSSHDKTVRVWEVQNPSCSIRTLHGHATSVLALDFHPNNEDLLCSCDGNSEIRYWSISRGTCLRRFKGGTTALRFQPRVGKFLAASAGNVVTIFDMESGTSVYCHLTHLKPVRNLCWSASGDILVSVSEDYVKVWSIGSTDSEGILGERSKCIYELHCKKMFQSCVFHPHYPSLLVIGCHQFIELWNMAENKMMTVPAHNSLIVSIVSCPITGMVASASHDKSVKLWK